MPDKPELPFEPDNPEVPDEPPDVPEVPAIPDDPCVPDEPAVPLVPDEPDVPDVPDEPDPPPFATNDTTPLSSIVNTYPCHPSWIMGKLLLLNPRDWSKNPRPLSGESSLLLPLIRFSAIKLQVRVIPYKYWKNA